MQGIVPEIRLAQKRGPEASYCEQLCVNVCEAAIERAADLQFVGGYVAKHKAGFNVLGPGVADVGRGLADGHFFDEKTAFGSDRFDVFFEAGSETQGRVENLGVKDLLKHWGGCLN